MSDIQSKNQARKLVRDAQARANEERAQRERDNVDDLATFLVARTRFAAVEKWQADRVTQIALEADRRRDEHRAEGAVALARLRARGESITTIAKLAVLSSCRRDRNPRWVVLALSISAFILRARCTEPDTS